MEKNSILIVDDEAMNLKVLTHILQPDYNIYTAKDGVTALQMAEEYLPDLILLDIIMPEMDGYEVLTALKNSERTQKIPVIFVTGLSNVEDEEKGLMMGTADYISKPFNVVIVKLRVRNQIQIVNQIRDIERLSMKDQLTDIPNRRSFDYRLRTEWVRAIRENLQISIIMIDIDRFKHFNDTYGHLQGDMVLQIVAKIITQTLRRPADFAARWGGEEFAVLLPNTDSDGAIDIAEQMRVAIENVVMFHAGGPTSKVTISLGVNTQSPMQASPVDSFLSKADQALYQAKELGRNRVCQYDETAAKL